MKSTIIYQLDETDFQNAIEKAIESHVSDTAFARFEGRRVSTQTACDILNVHKTTLYRYIGAGKIIPFDRKENEEYKFDLRMLLEFKPHKYK